MRPYSEVGRIEKVSEAANEAYRTYASLYLDWCDDNMNHFLWRDIDIRPMREMRKPETDANIEHAYWNAAFRIARRALNGGYYRSLEQFYEEYPTMERFDKLLKRFAC